MPAASELVASGRSDNEVAALIGADWLVYQDLEDLVRAVRYDNGDIKEFDTSCFSGRYVTDDVTPDYLAQLQRERSDDAMSRREQDRQDAQDDDVAEVEIITPRSRAGAA